MPAIQVREFSTGAEMIAHYAAIKRRREAMRAPAPKPKPRPVVCAPKIIPEPPLVPPQPPEDRELVFRPLTMRQICNAVSRRAKIGIRDIASTRRHANVVRPRQMAMYLIKTLTTFSFPQIGRFLGGRDHTTILHGVKKIEHLRATDAELDSDLRALELELNPPPAPPADPNQMALPFAGEG